MFPQNLLTVRLLLFVWVYFYDMILVFLMFLPGPDIRLLVYGNTEWTKPFSHASAIPLRDETQTPVRTWLEQMTLGPPILMDLYIIIAFNTTMNFTTKSSITESVSRLKFLVGLQVLACAPSFHHGLLHESHPSRLPLR